MTEPVFRVFATPDQVAAAVAQHVAETLRATPGSTLGLATGKTFVPIYARLVELYRQGGFSFARATSFNLDEYVGLPAAHPASFASYMDSHLFSLVDLPPSRAHLPNVTGDLTAACAAYEDAIAAAGSIDLQLLGIGQNGHIGFNEPGSPFHSRTRIVSLTPSTIAANASDFRDGQTPPSLAVTMGIATILAARQIILVATGANKAAALRQAFHQKPTESLPASALQDHAAVTVFCDEAAASGVKLESAFIRDR